MIILAPISVGELLDKLTILNIKMQRISDIDKLKNVMTEQKELKEMADALPLTVGLSVLYEQLLAVNLELWDIEDSKRKHEKEKRFDDEFIQLSRQVYLKNDIRARLKKEINLLTGSTLVEEKSYQSV
jgi:hypothetical protein